MDEDKRQRVKRMTAIDRLEEEFVGHKALAKFLGLGTHELTQLVNEDQIRCCQVPNGAKLYFIVDIRNYLFHLRSDSLIKYQVGGDPYPIYKG